jgi:hypothetical protein
LRKNFRHLFLGPIVSLIGGPRIKPNNMGSGLKTNRSKSSSMRPMILGPSKGPKRRVFWYGANLTALHVYRSSTNKQKGCDIRIKITDLAWQCK